jgi:hypothetical protein
VAVVVFQDDDPGYLAWWERHRATGYVLTLPRQKGERPAMLHAARCGRLIPTTDGPMTRNPKACATDPRELAAWAEAEGWRLAEACHDCRAGAEVAALSVPGTGRSRMRAGTRLLGPMAKPQNGPGPGAAPWRRLWGRSGG